MIAIVDGGSTKCDWIVLNQEGKEEFKTRTKGFNPFFVSSKDIEDELKSNIGIINIATKVTELYFYGAGCSSDDVKQIVKDGLSKLFNKAEIEVDHDLQGAALAGYEGKPAIICILGTGSNSCYFDGKIIREDTTSLGWILGDEGSGSNIGKRLVQAYFNSQMPENIKKAFKDTYNLTMADIKSNVFENKYANAYLASLSIFTKEHKEDPFIQKLIYDCLKEFFDNQIMIYPEAKDVDINFIGSIAFFNSDVLNKIAKELGLKIGKIIKRPIDGLVDYHLHYKK